MSLGAAQHALPSARALKPQSTVIASWQGLPTLGHDIGVPWSGLLPHPDLAGGRM